MKSLHFTRTTSNHLPVKHRGISWQNPTKTIQGANNVICCCHLFHVWLFHKSGCILMYYSNVALLYGCSLCVCRGRVGVCGVADFSFFCLFSQPSRTQVFLAIILILYDIILHDIIIFFCHLLSITRLPRLKSSKIK